MKVGIIGVGAVGTAVAKALLLWRSCHELVLIDINESRARGVATDLSHGEPLCPSTKIRVGSYAELDKATVIIVTAGINEQAGGATDRDDERGRLRLLPENAAVYADIVPAISRIAPIAPILVVTDPPDPLAEVVGWYSDTNPVVSAGTFLDTLRFRVQIARRLGCHASSVDAFVIGEHGTSQVYVWSSAHIGGESVLAYAAKRGNDASQFQVEVERAVKFANIDIIEGTGASQHGIGIVTARLTGAILRDEGLVAPVGTHHRGFHTTLSLPSVIGANGVSSVLNPLLSDDEAAGLEASATAIREALGEIERPALVPEDPAGRSTPNTHLDATLLGAILLERGKVTDRQLAEGLRLQAESSTKHTNAPRLGEIFVAAEFVELFEVDAALREQQRRRSA